MNNPKDEIRMLVDLITEEINHSLYKSQRLRDAIQEIENRGYEVATTILTAVTLKQKEEGRTLKSLTELLHEDDKAFLKSLKVSLS